MAAQTSLPPPRLHDENAWTRHGSDAPDLTDDQVKDRRLAAQDNIIHGLREENTRLKAELGRIHAERGGPDQRTILPSGADVAAWNEAYANAEKARADIERQVNEAKAAT